MDMYVMLKQLYVKTIKPLQSEVKPLQIEAITKWCRSFLPETFSYSNLVRIQTI